MRTRTSGVDVTSDGARHGIAARARRRAEPSTRVNEARDRTRDRLKCDDVNESDIVDDDNGEREKPRHRTRRAFATFVGAAFAARYAAGRDERGGGDARAETTSKATHRATMVVKACDGDRNSASDRANVLATCEDGEVLGTIEMELYGDDAPATVRNFVELCRANGASTLRGTTFHKIIAGEYVVAGKSGSPRLAQVAPLVGEEWRNTDVLNARAFDARHFRPGTVSLALESAQSDGDFGVPTEFLITTGPAPVPSLDGRNIVFGRVTRGLDVVARLSATKTFKPSDTARAYNGLAKLVGDSRALKARAAWTKPTRALVITETSVEELAR